VRVLRSASSVPIELMRSMSIGRIFAWQQRPSEREFVACVHLLRVLSSGPKREVPPMSTRKSAAMAAMWCAVLLAACDDHAGPSSAPPTFDLVAQRLPFERPKLNALNELPGTPGLSQSARQQLDSLRAFFAHDFDALDTAVNQAHRRHVDGASKRDESRHLVRAIESTQLAGIDACEAWLAAKPDSYGAHRVCGSMWHEGALVARSGEYAHKVSPIRFALMRERLDRSNRLLEKAVTLSPKPVEALALLATNRMLSGDHQAGAALLERAEQILPADRGIHAVRINYALPEWGGSAQDVADAIARAKRAGVDADALLNFHDAYVARPHKLSNPGAEQQYWQQAIAENPSFDRLSGLAMAFARLENWRDTVPAATRWLESFPDHAEAYRIRALANERLGNIPLALKDYRTAAALGNDAAIETLVRAHIQGSLGLPAKNWSALEPLCRYGTALGSAAAANCLGSMSWEGDSVGPPFRTDVAQAFAWHRVAARAGHFNSQYDLGWLMLTGRAPGLAPEQAKTHGLFWLRRAAEQEHPFAKKKLEEGGHSLSEPIGPAVERAPVVRALTVLLGLLQIVFDLLR